MEIVSYCKFGLVRSLMSKVVHTNETGKILSFLSIMGAALHIMGGTAYRQVYNATLEFFPASEILLKASLWVVCAIPSYLVFKHRKRIDTWNENVHVQEAMIGHI